MVPSVLIEYPVLLRDIPYWDYSDYIIGFTSASTSVVAK